VVDVTDPQPVRSVLVVAGDLLDESDRASVRGVVDQLTDAGHIVALLVSQAAADREVDFLDGLRLEGVPVQVRRSATGLERRAGALGALAVTAGTIADSGANSIHVVDGAEHLVPHLRLARGWLLRGVSVESTGPATEGERQMSAQDRVRRLTRQTFSSMRAVRRQVASIVDRAGFVAEPLDRRARDAADYWTDADKPGWQVNSHWRGAAGFADEGRWRAIGAEHLAMLDELAPPDWSGRHGSLGRVVEWGIGGGANAVAFAPRSREFVGVDVSSDNLAEAGRQLAATGTPYVPVLSSVDDTTAAVAAIGPTCDLFLCLYVLELVPSREHGLAILDAARDVLRPGGVGLIQAKYRTASWRTRSRGRRYDRNLANMTTYDIEELWSACTARGLRPHAVRLVPRNDLDERYAYFVVVRD
jgi:methyltransferase family protein